MKKFLSAVLLFAMLLSISVSAKVEFDYSVANKTETVRLSKNIVSGITVDVITKSVMYSKDIDRQVSLSGNIVRVMTALTVDNERRNGRYDPSVLSDEDYEMLMAGMLLGERDEDARRLALAFSDSVEEFVQSMNRLAGDLGMTSTSFTNIDGSKDAQAVSTVRDIAALVYEVYVNSSLKPFLASNRYTTNDKQMIFDREHPHEVLSKESEFYDVLLKMFFASPFEASGTMLCFASMDSKFREVIGVVYYSGGAAAEYITSYYTDIKALEINAYTTYFQTDLSKVAKAAAKKAVYTLKDNTQVYVAVELPSSVATSTVKLFSDEYAALIVSPDACSIYIDQEKFPESVQVGQHLGNGTLKYANDDLLNVSLRVTKIKMPDGSIRSEDYTLYNNEAGAEQANAQYKRNDWILAVGLVCGVAVAAVVIAEFVRRKMMF